MDSHPVLIRQRLTCALLPRSLPRAQHRPHPSPHGPFEVPDGAFESPDGFRAGGPGALHGRGEDESGEVVEVTVGEEDGTAGRESPVRRGELVQSRKSGALRKETRRAYLMASQTTPAFCAALRSRLRGVSAGPAAAASVIGANGELESRWSSSPWGKKSAKRAGSSAAREAIAPRLEPAANVGGHVSR